jgi:hypothetical protein
MYVEQKTPSDPAEFHNDIYAGQVYRFAALAPMQELVGFTRQLLEEMLHPHRPPEIHRHFRHAEQVDMFARCEKAFSQSGEVKRLWQSVFETIGLDGSGLARDRLHLRFQPHHAGETSAPRSRTTATIAFHRDTWGSNLYAQTNWWAPIYPITAGRTFAIYPSLWTTPLRNSSAAFDMVSVLERSKAHGRNAVDADQAIPHLLEPIDPGLGVPVVIAPGAVIAFSSAHAHAGIPNSTGTTRISIETRTLWIDDVRSGRGAPNVDGCAPWMTLGLFRRVSDGVPLTRILGARSLEPSATSSCDSI